jgi:hypothetical protein
MAKKLDTSWFSLEKYNGLKDLDLSGWRQQLFTRRSISEVLLSPSEYVEFYKNDSKEGKESEESKELRLESIKQFQHWLNAQKGRKESSVEQAKRDFEQLKNNPIFSLDEKNTINPNESNYKYPFNTLSVESTPAKIIHRLGTAYMLNNVWSSCDRFSMRINITDIEKESINTPYDLLCINHGINETNWLANVMIDLSAPDKQIKLDFSHWLENYRKAIKYQPIKGYLPDIDLLGWEKNCLLPYIDLKLIAKIEKKTISSAAIAKLIFTDETKDFTDRVKRTIPDKAKILLMLRTTDIMAEKIKLS